MRYRLSLLSLVLAASAGCAAPPSLVRPVALRDARVIAIGEFSGRGGSEVSQDVTQAIEERGRFIIIAPERARRLAREVDRQQDGSGWRPLAGADLIVVGEVSAYGVETRTLSSGSESYDAVVEVYFEVIDLRTGEVRGARRVRRDSGSGRTVGDMFITALGERISRGARSGDSVRDGLIARVRLEVARAFALALTRG